MNRNSGKVKWGVVLGEPTERHTNGVAVRDNVGKWMRDCGGGCFVVAAPGEQSLYSTKKEAEGFAQQCCLRNHMWNYHAKKYNPHKEKKI